MARVALSQSKIRARRKKRRILMLSLAVGAVVVVIGLLAALANASFMRISAVNITGESSLRSQDISNLVLADISGSYFFIFPKNNIFLYPKYKTESDLLTQMPTIAKVHVEAKDFHTLNVTVSERSPKALWCGDSAQGAGACFWLDQDGLAYAAVSDLTLSLTATTTYQKYYGPLTADTPTNAQSNTQRHFLTADQFHSLSALIDALAQNQQGNAIQSVEVDAGGDVRVLFANNFKLLFSDTAAGADVYQRFVLALGSDAFVNHKLSDFQYLDLRFGDKLYYKLK